MQKKPNIITSIQGSLEGNQLELVTDEHIAISLINGIMMLANSSSEAKLDFELIGSRFYKGIITVQCLGVI